jgi:DNA-binding winged helix-turn-helix (wHTH) protein
MKRRYRLDDLIIDTGTRQITRGDVDLEVTGLSFDLLIALGQAAPQLLSADELNARVWPGQIVSAETIAQRVKMVRQLLGDDAANPRYIAGLRGHGYRALSLMVPLQEMSPAVGDSRVHELYVQARATIHGTSASKDDALKFLDEALALDPDFAPALAYRALVQAGSVPLTGAPRSLLILAERDATRALTLDASLADAHVARALVHADRREWLEAEAHFDAARGVEPANAFVNNLYALTLLRPTGQLLRARHQLTETYRALPADGFTLHELTLTHSLLGEDAEMSRYAGLTETLSGRTRHPWDVVWAFARAEARRKAFAQAEFWANEALPPVLRAQGGVEVLHSLYSALATPSEAPRACRAIESFVPALEGLQVDGRTRAFFIASLAALGSLDGAYDVIERFLFAPEDAARSVDLSDLWLPEMRLFRADRRFARLVERLGLAKYWHVLGVSPDVGNT